MTPRTRDRVARPQRLVAGLLMLTALIGCSGDDASADDATTSRKNAAAGGSRSDGQSGAGGAASGGSEAAGSGGGIVISGAGAGGANTCAGAEVLFGREEVTVALLIDQSLSMDKPFATSTRWQVVRDALLDPDKGFVKKLQADVRFGLTLYTGTAATCPLLAGVPPGADTYDAIRAVFDAAVPIDNTPTGESVATVAKQLAAMPGQEARHIVLATDGAPDTCAVPNPSTDGDKKAARDTSVAAVADAFAKGIRTHVISVGKEVGDAHLGDLANAGAGKTNGATYAVAEDAGSLDKALTAALYGIRSCVIALQGNVKPGSENTGDVRLDGAQLSAGTDWKLVGSNKVELQGQACQKLQSGSPSVSIAFACDGYVPAPK